jgi:hypothetical protein
MTGYAGYDGYDGRAPEWPCTMTVMTAVPHDGYDGRAPEWPCTMTVMTAVHPSGRAPDGGRAMVRVAVHQSDDGL